MADAGLPGPKVPSALDLINAARIAVPAVDYALGAAGVAAAGSLIMVFVGRGQGGALVLGGAFLAMILLFVFSQLVTSKSSKIAYAGYVLIWTVTIGFCASLLMVLSSAAFHVPSGLADILFPKSFYSLTDGSIWEHNSSILKMEVVGKEITFVYDIPKLSMVNQGVSKDTVLFKGRIFDDEVRGTAFAFRKACQPLSYNVDGRRRPEGILELNGDVTFRDDACNPTGHGNDTLTFLAK